MHQKTPSKRGPGGGIMRTKKAKRTRAQIAAHARARKMMRDPLYQEYRSWHFGLGVIAAVRAVRKYDALILAIEHTKPRQKLQCELAELAKADEEPATRLT